MTNNISEEREEEIHDIISLLEELWKNRPQERLGQILENYVFINGERGDRTSCAMFFQQDGKTKINLSAVLDELNEGSKTYLAKDIRRIIKEALSVRGCD